MELKPRNERAEYLRMLCIHAQYDGRSLFRRRPEKIRTQQSYARQGNIQFRRARASGKEVGETADMAGSMKAPKHEFKAVHDCIPIRIGKSLQRAEGFRKTKIIRKREPKKESAPKRMLEAFLYKGSTGSCRRDCVYSSIWKSTRILKSLVAGRFMMGTPVRAVMPSSVAHTSSHEGPMSVNQTLNSWSRR